MSQISLSELKLDDFKVDLCQKVIREKTAFKDFTPFHSSLLWRLWKGNPLVRKHVVNVNVSLTIGYINNFSSYF